MVMKNLIIAIWLLDLIAIFVLLILGYNILCGIALGLFFGILFGSIATS